MKFRFYVNLSNQQIFLDQILLLVLQILLLNDSALSKTKIPSLNWVRLTAHLHAKLQGHLMFAYFIFTAETWKQERHFGLRSTSSNDRMGAVSMTLEEELHVS